MAKFPYKIKSINMQIFFFELPSLLTLVHSGEVIDLIHTIRAKLFQSVHPEFFFVFPVRVTPSHQWQ
jgi:hypothetical protein